MTYHLFKDWRYIRTIDSTDSMLQTLAVFQYRESTMEQTMFTVLNSVDKYGFSQWYQKQPVVGGKATARHGIMFKHVKGEFNPDAPSYDDLLRIVPTGTNKALVSIYTRKDGHQVLGFGLVNGVDDIEQARAYALLNWNDPNDVPIFYELVPVAYQKYKLKP